MLAMMFVFRALGQSRLLTAYRDRASARQENTYAAYLAVLAQHTDALFAADGY
jgi:hypothetical protein